MKAVAQELVGPQAEALSGALNSLQTDDTQVQIPMDNGADGVPQQLSPNISIPLPIPEIGLPMSGQVSSRVHGSKISGGLGFLGNLLNGLLTSILSGGGAVNGILSGLTGSLVGGQAGSLMTNILAGGNAFGFGGNGLSNMSNLFQNMFLGNIFGQGFNPLGGFGGFNGFGGFGGINGFGGFGGFGGIGSNFNMGSLFPGVIGNLPGRLSNLGAIFKNGLAGGVLSSLTGGSFGGGFKFGSLGTLFNFNPALGLAGQFGGMGLPTSMGFGGLGFSNPLSALGNPLATIGGYGRGLGLNQLNFLPNIGQQLGGRLRNLQGLVRNGLFGGLLSKLGGGSFGQGFGRAALGGLLGGTPGALLNSIRPFGIGNALTAGLSSLGARFQSALLLRYLSPNNFASNLLSASPLGNAFGNIRGGLRNAGALIQNMALGALVSKISGGSIGQGLQFGSMLSSAYGIQRHLTSLPMRATNLGLSFARSNLGRANQLLYSGMQLPIRFQNSLYAKISAANTIRGAISRQTQQVRNFGRWAGKFRAQEQEIAIDSF
jgi:hypothetical protein